MFLSRIKGALESHIDSQIQQEQTRSRTGQRPGSPAQRPRAKNAAARGGKEKDPSEFEESDVGSIPSRVGTPALGEGVTEDPLGTAAAVVNENDRPGVAGGAGEKKEVPSRSASPALGASPASSSSASSSNMELPTDVRVKLRKLERVESKHAELLRAYKTIHARNALIEPFEKALRENTPFESIGDPKPLIDYINSFALRADLAKEELIRVSKERDEHKSQVQKLREEHDTQDEEISRSKKAMGSDLDAAAGSASPKKQPGKSSDDIFSFDDEHDKLQSRIEEQQSEIEALKAALASARAAQKAAQEAAEGMQQNVENSQRELEGVRESGLLKDKVIGELAAKAEKLTKEVDEMNVLVQEKTKVAESKTKEAEEKAREARDKACELVEESNELGKKTRQLEERRQELKEKDTLVSKYKRDVESAKRMIDDLEQKVAGNGEVMKQLMANSKELSELREAKAMLQKAVGNLEGKLRETQKKPSNNSLKLNGDSTGAPKEVEPSVHAGAGKNAKKNKKKKGRGRGGIQGSTSTPEDGPIKDSEIVDDEPEPAPIPETEFMSESIIADLQDQLSALRLQLYGKDAEISRFNTELREKLDAKEAQLSELRSKTAGVEELREEIEFLRDDFVNLGQEHVEAMEKLKRQNKDLQEARAQKEVLDQKAQALELDLVALNSQYSSSSADTEKSHASLKSEYESLKQKASNLQTDLSAAQQLAATRYKDLMELRGMIEKAQPELVALRAEVATLTAGKNETNQKLVELKRLERCERDLKNDITNLNKKISEKESEVEKLRIKVRDEAARRVQAEEATKRTQKDLRKAEDERKEALETADKNARDHARAQEEINSLKPKIAALEKDIRDLKEDKITLNEELELKVAQYTSSQSLMGSMRDQTGELAMQMKEAVDKCESMEEELSEAHRLLTERSREAETMRRLLTEVEDSHGARTREMKERMDAAFDERDKAEEEAATIGRRRAREIEQLQDRVGEAERGLKRVEEAREIAERELTTYKDGKRKIGENLERVQREYEETKKAMASMRDSLDATDSQIEEIERQKAELRKSTEETHEQYQKLQKAHKTLQDELRSLQSLRTKGKPDHLPHPRSSVDSIRSGRASPTPPLQPSPGNGNQLINVEYLKNVLLRFLEQKDKKTQLELVPVLGMLLKFDKKDEQKWTAVVSAK